MKDDSYQGIRPQLRSKKIRQAPKAKINQHEQDLADRLGGIRQPASGAMPAHKGDIKLDNFLLDSKETVGSTILVNGKDLTKITREAAGEGKDPGLILKVDRVPYTTEKEWALIPISVFSELLKKI